MDGIPASFQLAGHTIEVRCVKGKDWKHGRNSIGIWLPSEYRIELRASLKGTHRQQVFCHEAMHAILDVAGYTELSKDEALVDRIGHLLQQALTTFQ